MNDYLDVNSDSEVLPVIEPLIVKTRLDPELVRFVFSAYSKRSGSLTEFEQSVESSRLLSV